MDKRQKLIDRLNKKQVRLSYSSLKNFTTPINFINYKLKRFNPNAGMIFGSVGDCLLLTPEDFDNQYKISPQVPSTDLQISYANNVVDYMNEHNIKDVNSLNDEDIEMFYVQSDYSQKGDISTKAEKTFRSLEIYFQAVAIGKTIIKAEVYEEAKKVIDNLKNFDDVALLLENKLGVQQQLDFERGGWKFRSYLDFTLPNTIWDLKYSKDADPDKFLKDIGNLGYDFQAGVYTIGSMTCEEPLFEYDPNYAFLVYDKSGQYSIIEMDYSYIRYGQRKFEYNLEAINRCVEENAWDKSYEFFNRKTVAYKPKWAKGYELLTDKQE